MAAHLVVRKLVDHRPKDAVTSAQTIPILGDQRVDEAARERKPDRHTAILGVEGDTDGFVAEAAITHDAGDFIAQREERLPVEAHEVIKALAEPLAHVVRDRHLLASGVDDHIGVVVDHDRVRVDEVRANRKVAGARDTGLQLVRSKLGHGLPVHQQRSAFAHRDLVALCNARKGGILNRDVWGQVNDRTKLAIGLEILDATKARRFPGPALVGIDGVDIGLDLPEVALGVIGEALTVEVEGVPRLVRLNGRYDVHIEPVWDRVRPHFGGVLLHRSRELPQPV